MALINTSLPNLIQGVSQQPDALRYDGQCEEQENALSSVVDGLTKRPNTRHVARLLQSAIAANSFIHFVDRDDNEKYVVIHDGTKMYAWNIITGVEATINDASGGYTPAASDYAFSTTPREDLKALNVGDSTLLLNNKKIVLADSEKTTNYDLAKALFFVKQGDYEKTYDIEINIPAHKTITLTENRVATTGTINFADFDIFTTINADDRISGSTTTTTASNVSVTDPEQVQSITVSNPRGVPLSSTNPIRIFWRGKATGDPNYRWIELTNGFDVTYDDATQEILSIQANANNESYLPYASEEGETFDEVGLVATDSDGYSTGTSLFRSLKTGSAQTSGSEADTAAIALKLALGGAARNTLKDTYGADETNGDFTFSQLKSDGTAYTFSSDIARSHVFFLSNTAGNKFSTNVSDGLSGEGLGLVYREVPSITDLPLQSENGYSIKVVGDADLNQDDYYVDFQTNDGQPFGRGSWVERAGFNVSKGLDNSTMPHRLINTGLNTFTIESIDYNDRVAGDEDTNPHPSFVNNRITNLFIYKNRLGFLSNENVSLSGSGDLFNFYRDTVTALLDDGRIDVNAASGRVVDLASAVGFQENLVLFGERGQFVLKGGDILTPKTVSITPITNFDTEIAIDPIALGSYIYFPFTRGGFSGLREFTVNATSDTYDSVEVTNHVPSYIPKNITQMEGTSSEDMLVLVSADEPSSAYVYKYFWNGNQKVLSAWSKFTLTGDIRGIHFVESTLYVVLVHNGETQLLEMPLESGLKDAAGYTTYLDQRVSDTVLNGNDTITLPYTPDAGDTIEVYTKDGLKLQSSFSGSTVTLAQPVSEDTDVWVGYPYTMKYTFSEQLFKASAGNSKSPSAASKLMVRNGAVFFDDTAYFQVKVTPKARQTYTNTFTPDVVGSTTIGELSLDSGFYRFPVFTKAADTTITIENDSALPSNFQSAEFESFVHSRSNRYG